MSSFCAAVTFPRNIFFLNGLQVHPFPRKNKNWKRLTSLSKTKLTTHGNAKKERKYLRNSQNFM